MVPVTAANTELMDLGKEGGAGVECFPKHVQGPRFDPKHQQRQKTYFGLLFQKLETVVT